MRALLALALWAATGPAFADGNPLAAEANRRNDALVAGGYNFTHGLSFNGATTLELLLPPVDADEQHTVALWSAAAQGEVTIELRGPHALVGSWHGKHVDEQLTRVLPPGKYAVRITAAGRAYAVVGIKGAVVSACAVDPARLHQHDAAPARGFFWPYLLVAPKAPTATTLLVLPNNTGFATDDVAFLRASATCQIAETLALADRLGTPILVPLFPRPPSTNQENLYLHALTRAALTTTIPLVGRVDRQLVAMIDDARQTLHDAGATVDARVLMTGFSAAGSFTNRFLFLHPDRVLAAAVGSPGGWPLAPAQSDQGAPLPYPVGIADLGALTKTAIDWTALHQVSLLFFLGQDDRNDAVPFRDSFSAADEALIMGRFGKTPVERWPVAERLYREAHLSARFVLYPGIAHEEAPAMRADVEKFFVDALVKKKDPVDDRVPLHR